MSEASTCTRCGASFTCGAEAGDDTCWCVEYPALQPQSDAVACLCPACLADFAKEQGKGQD